jgi:hypothetical protein
MFFFCDDDATLQKLADEYGPGPVRAGNKMLTGEAKKLLIETLKPIIMQHQKVRTFSKRPQSQMLYILLQMLKSVMVAPSYGTPTSET